MVFTHSGKAGDFFSTLPIYSAWYKKNNEKVTIIVPENFPFANTVKQFTENLHFVKNFIISPYNVWNFDCGGIPYKFNPNEYGINCETWFNIGFRHSPTKYISEFCAEEHGLEYDHNFELEIPFDLELHEKYKNKIGFADAGTHRSEFGIVDKIIKKSGVDFHTFDINQPLIENLRIAKHCKYTVMSASSMAVLMAFAKIPFSVYTWQTPPHMFYSPHADIFCIWQTPHYILEQTPEKIIKILNLQDKI